MGWMPLSHLLECILRRVVPVVLSGDLKFLEKLDEKIATGAYHCCRFCNCIGIGNAGPSSRTVYYPLRAFSDYRMEEFTIYDRDGNAMNKCSEAMVANFQDIETHYLNYLNDPSKKNEWEKRKKEIGFKRFPIIYTIKTLNPSCAITIDSMHFISNFAKTIYLITNNDEEKGKPHHKYQPYSLSKKIWSILSSYVDKMKSPTSFGRLPKTPNGPGKFKAIEWKFFFLNLLIPLLYAANVSMLFLKPLAALIGDLKFLIDKRSSTIESFRDCQRSLITNYIELEMIIINADPEDTSTGMLRLDFCTSNTHLLLHLIKGILDQGPFFIYSQWALESKLGMLRDFVFNRSKPEENLVKNIKAYTQSLSIGPVPGYCML
jgi:hypothetical protein